jgi:hypothetical protein
VSPALGALAGARVRAGLLLPPVLVWMIALAWSGRQGGLLPRPDLAGLAVAALYTWGAALGALRGAPAWRLAAVLLLATGLLAALATGGGVLAEPWPPALAARLLDLSPVGLVHECGGLDWMREPAVYDAAGTASIPPDLRVAWTGPRAAPVALLTGILALVAARLVRARGRS